MAKTSPHDVHYVDNPHRPHGAEDAPGTGVPQSPTHGNPEPPRHPDTGQFVPRKGA